MNARYKTIHEQLQLSSGPPNTAGEVKGLGPEWVCDNYAEPGHDYGTCTECYDIYENQYLPKLKGAQK
ncbi:MAG: hypothetical protein HY888_08440 [Deltaproteobacteria bacterium]|nr:hypothetical protein [Deltaproteobacteria bacterium]